MNTVVMTWVLSGLSAMTFFIAAKYLFGHLIKVPGLSDLVMAA